jgi:hypothetical protein
MGTLGVQKFRAEAVSDFVITRTWFIKSKASLISPITGGRKGITAPHGKNGAFKIFSNSRKRAKTSNGTGQRMQELV